MKKNFFVPLFTLLLTFGLTACSFVTNIPSDTNMLPHEQKETLPVQSAEQKETIPTQPAGQETISTQPIDTIAKIDNAKAKEIVLAHAGAAADTVTKFEIEYDIDDGIPSYEIEFIFGGAEYDYDIHAETGEILKAEKDDQSLLVPPDTRVTADSAKQTALHHAGLKAENVTQFEIELDTEGTISHYEISFKSGGFEYDYDINAETGAIIKSEKEMDD